MNASRARDALVLASICWPLVTILLAVVTREPLWMASALAVAVPAAAVCPCGRVAS